MQKAKTLQQEVSSLGNFLMLIEAYEEIAASRMRKVKKLVLSRREFMQGLNDAFGYVIYAYNIYRSALKGKSENRDRQIANTNGKTVSVLITSNTGLYGDIIRSTFDLFISDIVGSNTDAVIVGKLGRRFYENANVSKEYEYFEISDKGIDEENIGELMEYVSEYSNVIVYHGVFKSILRQDADKTFVTGEVLKIEENIEGHDASFIFEPSVERIAEYFEKQILGLIFEQTIFEASLSKFASRMVSLDTAAEGINTKLEGLSFDLKKVKHRNINQGIQSNLAGEALWK